MPNHVDNIIKFKNVPSSRLGILIDSLVLPKDADKIFDCLPGKFYRFPITFEQLLPLPLNCWRFDVGTKHSIFPDNGIDWARKNWGTKWNCYGNPQLKLETGEDSSTNVTITFRTAWSPPMGWLLALFNKTKLNFTSAWLDEGDTKAYVDVWSWNEGDRSVDNWVRREATEEETLELSSL